MFQYWKATQIKFFFFLSVSFLLLLNGCNTDTTNQTTLPQIYLLPGETAVRIKEVCFYIGSDAKPKDQTLVRIPTELFPVLLSEPVWSMPQGIELKTANIDLSPCLIVWEDGEKQYSVHGAKLSITYEISADSTSRPVEGDISISFENLNNLKGENIFYIDTLTTPITNPDRDSWQLNHVVIFSTAAEKEAAITKANKTLVFSAIILIAIVVFVIWIIRKLFKSNK